jgi:NPCBM/NEW2 domain
MLRTRPGPLLGLVAAVALLALLPLASSPAVLSEETLLPQEKGENPKPDRSGRGAEEARPEDRAAGAAEGPIPLPGAPVVETIAGTLQGPIRAAAQEGSAEDRAQLQVGEKSVPLDEVLAIRFPSKKTSSAEVLLVLEGGDALFAAIQGGDESELQLRPYAVRPPGEDGIFKVPLEDVRGLGFPRRFREGAAGLGDFRRWLAGPAARRREPLEPGGAPAGAKDKDRKDGSQDSAPGGEDRLLLVEGAELTGVLHKIDAETVQFQSGTAGDVRLPLAKVRALAVAALSSEPKGGDGAKGGDEKGEGGREPEKSEKPNPDKPEKRRSLAGLIAVVEYQDGSVLSGRLLSLSTEPAPGAERPPGKTGGALRLEHPVLGEVTALVDRVRAVSFRGGRCQYLSDLEPEKVSYRDDLFSRWELARDLAATGDPLRIRGKPFLKGLGMHSYCRADFPLGSRYSRFQAVLGMDDRAKPETQKALEIGAGSGIFRVYLDGKVVFEKELSFRDPPCPVDLPIEGARQLGLELDYGKGYLVLGRGDWADARIIRKS